MATRPDSMGIYADLAAKRAAKYDVELEKRCREWIEGVLGRKLEGDFRESLMDGSALCELINTLKPGTIKKVHKSPILMFRRENFGSFQRACLTLGCKESETCVFEDVYDNKNMGQFLINIISLARNTQYEPGYKGPILQDASRNSGPGAKPTGNKDAGPTMAEMAMRQAQEAKDAGRYTEHGVLMNPTDNINHGQKDATSPEQQKKTAYVGDYMDAAMRQAQEAKDAGRYTEHGILMNPSDNLNHGQKK